MYEKKNTYYFSKGHTGRICEKGMKLTTIARWMRMGQRYGKEGRLLYIVLIFEPCYL